MNSSLLDVTVENLSVDMLMDSNNLHDYTDTDNNFFGATSKLWNERIMKAEVNTSNHPIGTQRLNEARVQNDEIVNQMKRFSEMKQKKTKLQWKGTDHYQALVKITNKEISGEKISSLSKLCSGLLQKTNQLLEITENKGEKLPTVASSSRAGRNITEEN
ncbi:hypothetical protein JTB14_008524 [Gonioctena quinquepunctata]|nr:hypothetical protein JTB14_008524 [Gonioctena quinquepunctata]